MRQRIEQIGAGFTHGYHQALQIENLDELAENLNRVELEFRGFAYEGAAMGLALLDHLTPWQASRIAQFLQGAGKDHAYVIHVGVGWVWARLPFFLSRREHGFDPLLRWLAFDGWGFHEGFFHWPDYVAAQPWPRKIRTTRPRDYGTTGPQDERSYGPAVLPSCGPVGYETHAFDQGLGRSFWFVNGGNVAWISRTIANFPEARQKDLWSGIGLAAVYAGGVTESALGELRAAAGKSAAELAQGAAFAAKARERAGNLTDYTDMATRTLTGLSALDAARLTDSTLENLPAGGPEPAYEVWRRRIQQRFSNARKDELPRVPNIVSTQRAH